jgi:hypothetical protein
MRRSRIWFLIDEDTGFNIRGPYKHEETATAVRSELEVLHPYFKEKGNLQIVYKLVDPAPRREEDK